MEYNYFEFFRDKTALELSGYFDTDVWNRLVLQICHEEDFARQAVIAIGALTKTTAIAAACTEGLDFLEQPARRHYDYALRQYGKALQLMQDICHKEAKTRLRNTLISSLLTTCFESYIGNQENAVAQAKAGVDVLVEYQDRAHLDGHGGFLGLDLICTFARLDSQILTFRDTGIARRTSENWTTITPDLLPFLQMLPRRFDSVREARMYWDLIVEAAMLWVASHPSGFSILDFGENNIRENQEKLGTFSQKIQHELHVYTTVTEQWFQSFQPIFEHSRAQKDSKDFLGANILMIKYLSSRVAVPRLVQHCDTYQDGFLQDYIAVVELARDLLEADDRNHIRGKPIFIFDDSLVAGLFFVATRCRERIVRRQAIDLLRHYPRREGLWDSSMAAKVATWFVETEEAGMEDGFIPPSARMKIVKIDSILSERKAVVRCSKISGLEGTTFLPEVTLTW